MFNPEQILERKSVLLTAVVAAVVGILAAPVILPHAFHSHHIAHILLHVGGIAFATFLTILGAGAYFCLKSKKLLITTFAFMIFVVAEIVTLIEATWPFIYNVGGISLLEIGHLLMITSLGLISIGVFKND